MCGVVLTKVLVIHAIESTNNTFYVVSVGRLSFNLEVVLPLSCMWQMTLSGLNVNMMFICFVYARDAFDLH